MYKQKVWSSAQRIGVCTKPGIRPWDWLTESGVSTRSYRKKTENRPLDVATETSLVFKDSTLSPSLSLSRSSNQHTFLQIEVQMIYRGNGTPLQYSCLENPVGRGAWWAAVHGVAKSQTRLSDFTFTFHSHALEKEMATHSSVLAWRIPGTGEPGGLPSMGSHRVGHDWSDLAAAAAA